MHFVRDRRGRTDREGKTICKKRWEHTMAPCMVIGEQAAASPGILVGDRRALCTGTAAETLKRRWR